MICLSLADLKYQELKKILKQKKYFYELRLDLLKLNDNEVSKLLKINQNVILTDRTKKLSKMLKYFELGARLIDVDYNNIDVVEAKYFKYLIVSYHNFRSTPKNLEAVFLKIIKNKAKLYKIVCFAKTYKDNIRLLDLEAKHKKLIVQAMGHKGLITRALAEFTYAYYKTPTAEGQIFYKDLEKLRNMFLK